MRLCDITIMRQVNSHRSQSNLTPTDCGYFFYLQSKRVQTFTKINPEALTVAATTQDGFSYLFRIFKLMIIGKQLTTIFTCLGPQQENGHGNGSFKELWDAECETFPDRSLQVKLKCVIFMNLVKLLLRTPKNSLHFDFLLSVCLQKQMSRQWNINKTNLKIDKKQEHRIKFVLFHCTEFLRSIPDIWIKFSLIRRIYLHHVCPYHRMMISNLHTN